MELHDLAHGTQSLGQAFDDHGVVGPSFRSDVGRGLMAGLLLREGQDAVQLLGAPGTGKSLMADVVHELAESVLGRANLRSDLDCGGVASADFADALSGAVKGAHGGTLVLDRLDRLDAEGLRQVERLSDGEDDVLVVGLAHEPAQVTGARIQLKPLHEREDDIWALVDHYFVRVAAGLDGHGCEGFSRQAKADIAAQVKDTAMASLGDLRDIVRDSVFEAAAQGELPEKITSDWVRPILESRYGQVAADRVDRDAALLESAFEALENPSMVARLAEIHGVSEEILTAQAEVMRAAINTLDGLPRSYRNIMDRADDILRASLWLVSDAETQAEFRRFFGEERFMRPTKSVAWAFYNRVFKRDMG